MVRINKPQSKQMFLAADTCLVTQLHINRSKRATTLASEEKAWGEALVASITTISFKPDPWHLNSEHQRSCRFGNLPMALR